VNESREAGHTPGPDRDAAIRMWHKHCGKFMSHLEIGPASCLIDAMLEFATIAGSEQYDAAERDGIQESRELVVDYERAIQSNAEAASATQAEVECERSGEAPSAHVGAHWCENQSFAARPSAPAREPLTRNEIRDAFKSCDGGTRLAAMLRDDVVIRDFIEACVGCARAVEAAHGITVTPSPAEGSAAAPAPVGGEAAASAGEAADAAKRLRLICRLLGIESAVPDGDDSLMGCLFPVLGMIRRNIEERFTAPPPPMGGEPVAWLYEHFMPLQGKPVNVCAQIERANMAENLSPWGRPGYDFGGTVTETPLYTSPMGGEPLREVLLQSRLYVEAASTYKGPDVHSVGDQEIREEANRLLSEIDAALAAAPMRGEPASAAIFLVATGEVHEGKETYTRHEGRPPPLCDFEGPLSTSPKGGAAEGLVLVPKEPTPEMNRAGFYAHQATGLTGEIWRAMLAAAPQEWSQP
jgi:hypothetical protein